MYFKKYSKQRTNSIQGLRSFKDTLPTKIKKIIKKKGTIYPEILENWKYLVGNDLFKFSFPMKYKNSNKIKGSTLDIMIKRGKEVDLEFSKKIIIDNINSFFGYNVLEKIKIITFNKQEKDLKIISQHESKEKFYDNLNNIKNKNIKNSLQNLIKVFKNK